MRYESGAVWLWFIGGRWHWELIVNDELAAASVVYDSNDEKIAREIARWVAASLDVEFREGSPSDVERRKVRHRIEQIENDRDLVAGQKLGVVRPGRKRDLTEVLLDHEAEHPFTDHL